MCHPDDQGILRVLHDQVSRERAQAADAPRRAVELVVASCAAAPGSHEVGEIVATARRRARRRAVVPVRPEGQRDSILQALSDQLARERAQAESAAAIAVELAARRFGLRLDPARVAELACAAFRPA